MKQKLLYITHTPWGWIKQRPQFIAEGLSDYFDIDIFYRKSNHILSNWNKEKEETLKHDITIHGFLNLPFERFVSFPIHHLYKINKLLWITKRVNLDQYDYIWVTDSLLWWLIKDSIRSSKVIYDCMDDALAFPYTIKYAKLFDFYKETESELVQTADYVFCSSSWLAKTIQQRYHTARHIDIVNNAISNSFIAQKNSEIKPLQQPTLTYIGTIAEWFDFDMILRVLDRYPSIEVRLYGPIRTQHIPTHERLKYMGSISHDRIIDVMHESTGLIMPFIINDLILSVNPVKLYEYIYSGKPIAAVKYGESEKFKEYVTLYSSNEEFYNFIDTQILQPSSLDIEKMLQYALSNTWSERCNQIYNILSA